LLFQHSHKCAFSGRIFPAARKNAESAMEKYAVTCKGPMTPPMPKAAGIEPAAFLTKSVLAGHTGFHSADAAL
jgi:hypothetical protein